MVFPGRRHSDARIPYTDPDAYAHSDARIPYTDPDAYAHTDSITHPAAAYAHTNPGQRLPFS